MHVSISHAPLPDSTALGYTPSPPGHTGQPVVTYQQLGFHPHAFMAVGCPLGKPLMAFALRGFPRFVSKIDGHICIAPLHMWPIWLCCAWSWAMGYVHDGWARGHNWSESSTTDWLVYRCESHIFFLLRNRPPPANSRVCVAHAGLVLNTRGTTLGSGFRIGSCPRVFNIYRKGDVLSGRIEPFLGVFSFQALALHVQVSMLDQATRVHNLRKHHSEVSHEPDLPGSETNAPESHICMYARSERASACAAAEGPTPGRCSGGAERHPVQGDQQLALVHDRQRTGGVGTGRGRQVKAGSGFTVLLFAGCADM